MAEALKASDDKEGKEAWQAENAPGQTLLSQSAQIKIGPRTHYAHHARAQAGTQNGDSAHLHHGRRLNPNPGAEHGS